MDRKEFLKLFGILPVVGAMSNLSVLSRIAEEFPSGKKMPLLFLGHGSPMNAIEENQFVDGFREVSGKLPRPNAILCVSAHWFIPGTKVTSMEMPRTIHDFYGFPKELFDVQYQAKGSPKLARLTKDILNPALVELDEKWGLDHGAWSVIKHLYPNADVPVIQLSIDSTKPSAYHFELASQLSSLREKGILIIGSGNIVHNLSMVDWANFDKDDYGFEWAEEARQKINSWLLDRNFEPIINYHKQGKSLELSAPSPDHFLPLICILGLMRKSDEISLFNDKLVAGSLSMTSVRIG
jgi:4,5-DOPA dioxygenase extradiol